MSGSASDAAAVGPAGTVLEKQAGANGGEQPVLTATTTATAGSNNNAHGKLRGREFYESIGSPKYILAPMVDRSEFVCSSTRLLYIILSVPV